MPRDHQRRGVGIQLEIPARAEYVALVRLLISSLASTRRILADSRIDDLKLAVSEACTNAVEATRSGAKRVVVRWREEDDRLSVDIEDEGRGFDPANLTVHPPVTDPQRLNFERGLGIPLIRSLVDEAEFDPSSEGTSVRLVMYCGPTDSEDSAEDDSEGDSQDAHASGPADQGQQG